MNIWRFLKEKISDYGEKTAFVCGDKTVKYADLTELVECDDLKGTVICSQNDACDQAIAVLRSFYNNAVAVPVNPAYGTEYLNRIETEIANNSGIQPNKNTACIMFTSGSTGKPKGVMLSHKNIISNILAIEKYFKIDKTDSILIARPLMHAAVLTGELLVSLYRGLTIHFYPEAFQPQRIITYIQRNGITVFCGTPTIFSLLCRYIKTPLVLKSVAVSGEVLGEETARKMSELFSDTNIYSVYGLTEASPRVSYLPPKLFNKKFGSIGIPIDGVQMVLKDGCDNELSGKNVGRLCVKSPGIMQGYFGCEALTDQRIRNGFLDTVDIAYRDSDGFYYIKGRADNMVIRSGMNVYPEEIENIVKQSSGITEALCYAYRSRFGIVIRLNVVTDLDLDAVQQIIKQSLPAFMQPNQINIVEKIEKNENGKVKRKP